MTNDMTNEEAIDYFKRSYANGNNDDERYHNEVLAFAIKALEERPKGNWIKEKDCLLTYRCSNCKKIVYSREVESDEKFEDLSRLDSYKYCPRCGAEMKDTPIKGKCIDCSCKTNTCQEGLHCPRD